MLPDAAGSVLHSNVVMECCSWLQIHVVNAQEDFPLFSNASIGREYASHVDCSMPPVPALRTIVVLLSACLAGRLRPEAIQAFLDDLVAAGNAEWTDVKAKRQCIILWRKVWHADRASPHVAT
jgi:hypothetical protein